MTRLHNVPDAIQWYEGMLLGPQHFQEMSFRSEGLLQYHLRNATSYRWGVLHLQIDSDLLRDGKLRVSELEAIMPDGLAISSSHLAPGSLTIDLEEHKNEMATGPLTVHLASPSHGDAKLIEGEMARFESHDAPPVPDRNTGADEITIPRLRPRAALMTGETPPDRFTSFPLAQINYTNGTFLLTNFVAPTLRIASHSAIGEKCATVAARLRERAIMLSERAASPSAGREGSDLLSDRLRLHGMVSALPLFEGLLHSGEAHPFQLYLAACSLMGQTAVLGLGGVPPVIPYEHKDLEGTFSQISDYIDQMIREGFIESHDAYRFSWEEGAFELLFDSTWKGRSLVLGARAGSMESMELSVEWIQKALIASGSLMPSIDHRRILGAQRKRIDGEGDLAASRGLSLYSLESPSEFIRPNEPLQIYNPKDTKGEQRPADIVLYVRKPRSED